MNEIQQQLQKLAATLLQSGEVGCVIGWGATSFAGQTKPLFIRDPAEAGRLLWNRHCPNTLAKYLLNQPGKGGKTALCTRGCEARAVNRLLADGQIQREQVYLIGLPCPGMMDESGQTLAKCAECSHPNPLLYDTLLGSPAAEPAPRPRFAEIAALEALDADQRYQYWADIYQRCIRCYACRNVCPACNCRECYTEQYRTGWQGKQHNQAQNQIFGLTRAYHVAGRCLECGECSRVCPMELPLMLLNRKLIQDVNELFGEQEAGLSPEEQHLLSSYRLDDREEFM